MAQYVFGIKSVKFAAVAASADSTMGTPLVQWAQTVEGTLTLSETEATTKEFKVEEVDLPIKKIVSEPGSLTVTWRAYDCDPAMIAVVKGGVATGSTQWAAPASSAVIEKSLEIETTEGVKFNIYRASIFARLDGTVTRGDLLQMEVKATVLSPESATSPYAIVFPT